MPTSVQDMDISVFAGSSPLSERSVCISRQPMPPSGFVPLPEHVGPSLSFGKADAVMIVCSDVMQADTYANRFRQHDSDSGGCFRPAIEKNQGAVKTYWAAIAIKDDKLGICGNFELKTFLN